MPCEYACFVSYRAQNNDIGKAILKRIHDALKAEIALRTKLPVYLDQDRLQGADFFNEALSAGLCKSACLVAIYTDTYFCTEKTYCAREYRAMEILEAERLATLGETVKGLIIPIILRGSLPAFVRSERNYYDFSQYSLADKRIEKHPKYTKHIQQIASVIKDRCDLLSAAKLDCAGHQLPGEADIQEWLKQWEPKPPEFPTP